MDIYYVPLWLCSLNLIIQLFSNFTNTNMSAYFSIPMINIRIGISQSLVVSGPSIKYDWVWPTLTKLWLRLSLNQTIWLWPLFSRINLSLHLLNPTDRFHIWGQRMMDVCCVPLWQCSLNLTIQLFSNFTNTNMSPYFLFPMIKILIWISQSLVVSRPSIKFDRGWPTLTKFWPCLSLNPTVWFYS